MSLSLRVASKIALTIVMKLVKGIAINYVSFLVYDNFTLQRKLHLNCQQTLWAAILQIHRYSVKD